MIDVVIEFDICSQNQHMPLFEVKQHPRRPKPPTPPSLALPNHAKKYYNPRVLIPKTWRRRLNERLVLLGLLVRRESFFGCSHLSAGLRDMI